MMNLRKQMRSCENTSIWMSLAEVGRCALKLVGRARTHLCIGCRAVAGVAPTTLGPSEDAALLPADRLLSQLAAGRLA